MRADKFLVVEGKSRRRFGRRYRNIGCIFFAIPAWYIVLHRNVSAAKEDRNNVKEIEKEEETNRLIEKDT